MLEKLFLNNELWYKMALQISRNNDTAKDLVQDMYIKLHNIDKEVNEGYVYFTLKSIYLNQTTRNKEFCFSEIEIDDTNELYDYDNDNDIQEKIDLIDDCLNRVPLARKLIVKHSIEDGLRKFSRESQINKATVQKHRKEFKEMVWQRKLKG